GTGRPSRRACARCRAPSLLVVERWDPRLLGLSALELAFAEKRRGGSGVAPGVREGEDGGAEVVGELGGAAVAFPGGDGGAQDGGVELVAERAGEVGGEGEEGELAVDDVQEPTGLVDARLLGGAHEEAQGVEGHFRVRGGGVCGDDLRGE